MYLLRFPQFESTHSFKEVHCLLSSEQDNHLNWLFLIFPSIGVTPIFMGISSFQILSLCVFPLIYLNNHIYELKGNLVITRKFTKHVSPLPLSANMWANWSSRLLRIEVLIPSFPFAPTPLPLLKEIIGQGFPCTQSQQRLYKNRTVSHHHPNLSLADTGT